VPGDHCFLQRIKVIHRLHFVIRPPFSLFLARYLRGGRGAPNTSQPLRIFVLHCRRLLPVPPFFCPEPSGASTNNGPTLDRRGCDCRTHETFLPPPNPFPDLPWLNKQHPSFPLPNRPYEHTSSRSTQTQKQLS